MREPVWRLGVLGLLIVVLGILIALRMDEWKDRREEQRAVAASLTRLAQDIDANRQICDFLSAAVMRNRDSIWQVYASLQAGRILDDDAGLFEQGLVNADFMPHVPVTMPAYDEMVATGLLRALEDTELAAELARLKSEVEIAWLQIPDYRSGPSELASELRAIVDFRYAESPDHPRVSYDFDALAESRRIRNLYYEAVASHGDLAFHVTRICDLVRRIDERLSGPGGQDRASPS